MAKISFTLHEIADDIRNAEKKLRKMKPKVMPADQKKIELELQVLDKAYGLIRDLCPKGKHPTKPFGQWFETKPK